MIKKLRTLLSELRLYLVNNWVAYVPSHTIRLFFYRHVMDIHIGQGSYIFMGCHFDCAGNLVIGKNSTINQRCHLDSRGTLQIGDFVSISSKVTIQTADHDPDCPDFSGRIAPVILGDYVFIGTGAIILKGVKIETGAIVGAGSVVTHNIPAGEIWAGNPARKIRSRKNVLNNERQEYGRLLH